MDWCYFYCKVGRIYFDHKHLVDSTSIGFAILLISFTVDDYPDNGFDTDFKVTIEKNPDPTPAIYFPSSVYVDIITLKGNDDINGKIKCDILKHSILYEGIHNFECVNPNSPTRPQSYEFEISTKQSIVPTCVDYYVQDIYNGKIPEGLEELPLYGPTYVDKLIKAKEFELVDAELKRDKNEIIRIASYVILFFDKNHLDMNSQLVNQFRTDENGSPNEAAIKCSQELHELFVFKFESWLPLVTSENFFLLKEYPKAINIIDQEIIKKYESLSDANEQEEMEGLLVNGQIIRSNSYYKLSFTENTQKNLDIALEGFNAANSINETTDGILGVALVLMEKKQIDEAITMFTKAVNSDYQREDIHGILIKLLNDTKRFDLLQQHMMELEVRDKEMYDKFSMEISFSIENRDDLAN